MKVEIALQYLNLPIKEGDEFPEAFYRAASRFRLKPQEKVELKQLYDQQ